MTTNCKVSECIHKSCPNYDVCVPQHRDSREEYMVVLINDMCVLCITYLSSPEPALKPCAHCGGRLEIKDGDTAPSIDMILAGHFVAWCEGCHAVTAFYHTRLEAITAANRRPEEPAKQGFPSGLTKRMMFQLFGCDSTCEGCIVRDWVANFPTPSCENARRAIYERLGIDWRK